MKLDPQKKFQHQQTFLENLFMYQSFISQVYEHESKLSEANEHQRFPLFYLFTRLAQLSRYLDPKGSQLSILIAQELFAFSFVTYNLPAHLQSWIAPCKTEASNQLAILCQSFPLLIGYFVAEIGVHLHQISHSQITQFLTKELKQDTFNHFILNRETLNWLIYFLCQRSVDSNSLSSLVAQLITQKPSSKPLFFKK